MAGSLMASLALLLIVALSISFLASHDNCGDENDHLEGSGKENSSRAAPVSETTSTPATENEQWLLQQAESALRSVLPQIPLRCIVRDAVVGCFGRGIDQSTGYAMGFFGSVHTRTYRLYSLGVEQRSKSTATVSICQGHVDNEDTNNECRNQEMHPLKANEMLDEHLEASWPELLELVETPTPEPTYTRLAIATRLQQIQQLIEGNDRSMPVACIDEGSRGACLGAKYDEGLDVGQALLFTLDDGKEIATFMTLTRLGSTTFVEMCTAQMDYIEVRNCQYAELSTKRAYEALNNTLDTEWPGLEDAFRKRAR